LRVAPPIYEVPHEIFTPFWDKTWSHTKVAREPIGVIFGPKSDPTTLAYISASLTAPDVLVSAIDKASIITVGILFIIDDKNAAIKPIAIVAMNKPCSAVA